MCYLIAVKAFLSSTEVTFTSVARINKQQCGFYCADSVSMNETDEEIIKYFITYLRN